MNLQKFERPGKWLFYIFLAVGIILCSSIELLPLVVGSIFSTAILAFPAFRRRIRWSRAAFFIFAALLALLGMYYWILCNDSNGLIADFCSIALWPLDRYEVPLIYWPPFWIIKGLVLGLIFESFFILCREVFTRRDWVAEENGPPFGMAGLACLASLPIIYLTAQPLMWNPNPKVNGWLLPALFVIVPLSVAFLVLYRSSWQRELSAPKRALTIALRSCAILGVVFIVVIVLVFGVFVLSLFSAHPPSRGEYGAV